MRPNHFTAHATSTWGLVVLAPAFAGACTIYDCPTVYEPRAVVVAEAPPPVWERVAEAPEQPADDAVWVEGYWDWQGRWIWVEGHWETGRSQETWTEPHVVRVQDGYEYHPGYWRAQDTQPSPVYRRESDVRVSARFEGRATVSTDGASEGSTSDGRDTVRTQEASNETVRGGATSTGSTTTGSTNTTPARGTTPSRTATTDAPTRGSTTSSGGSTRPSSTATPSNQVRTEPQLGTYDASTGVRTGGQGTATPGTTTPGGTATPSGTTAGTGSGQIAPGRGSTRPDSAVGSGSEPASAVGGTAVGETGTPVVDASPRGVAAGPLVCEMEAGTVIAGGYANVRFPGDPPRGRPSITIGNRNAVIVAQQNQFSRVRVLVPMLGGGYSVYAVDELGRRGNCGGVEIINR